jgi:5S rRNA maturation endonuclease (ribonuclease M5)
VILPVPDDVEAALEELHISIIQITDYEILAKCPAHFDRLGKEDRHPSWSVVRQDKVDSEGDVTVAGTHGCFSCGFKGPFVGVVKYVLKCTDEEAEQWVKERSTPNRFRILANLKKKKQTNTLEIINEAKLALYIPPPKKELDKRQLRAFSAKQYGLLWDEESKAWIIPIRDPYTYKLMGWQYKKKHFFGNRPKDVKKGNTLFGLNVFTGPTGILLESPLDAVRMHSVGYNGAVSSFGVEVSSRQLNLMAEYSSHWVIAMDDDDAGIRVSRKIKYELKKRGVKVNFLDYGYIPGKDVGTDSVTDQDIQKAMENLIPSALVRF